MMADDPGSFAATRWSVVLAAGSQDTDARAALETLCRTYWHPLYVYARGRGYSQQDAEDLTQSFLAHLLDKHRFARADPQRGRFRSFLLAGMNHFMADEWDKSCAQKRGGGQVFPMDFQEAETWVQGLVSTDATPEQAFEKQWALSLLHTVYQQLRNQYEQRGKGDQFEVLNGTLAGSREAAPYAELAASLQMTEGAVRVAVHRLRGDYRKLLRETIADLVSDPADVEEELRYLQEILGRAHSSSNNPGDLP
jgi:RNA polymerase sigma-70 factor (ECF subfamily)